MKRVYPILALLLGSLLAAPGAAQGAEAAKAVHNVVEVRIMNVAFEPATLTVRTGTTVRWVNMDPVVHDVTSGTAVTGRRARQVEKTKFPDGRFHSGVFGKEGSFEWTFTAKGTYRYFCNVHPIMQATVIVE